jgi:drug/metabolite transporter (DMT)-like permease
MIASYTIVDGLGVRHAGTVLGFAVWLTIVDGLLTFLIIYLWKGREAFVVAKRSLGTGIFGGTMQVAAYWIIVWALASAPMATVSALRETSVLFAALISTFILGEGFGVWRFVSSGLVTLGLIATKSGK